MLGEGPSAVASAGLLPVADVTVALSVFSDWLSPTGHPRLADEESGALEMDTSAAAGRVPNKITSWLIECRTPLGASLDDRSASPSRGAPRNGCSFEDDLSLGAEANHLHSSNNKTDSCFGLAAEQKRSQYKEKGRSMNSTGSGKSSTVSSVSELLDLYEEDPEEILLNLGFGREEPDLSAKVPTRFFNNTSSARGIDIKVYLGAQMQRMELENPNYALTSRFRQIEVLTTVANEFFQLYSQVSGQPVERINSRDGGGEVGGRGGGDESTPVLKRSNSALNVAKLLKKTISKHNLLAAASESPEAQTPNQQTRLNGHTPSDHTLHTNGQAHAGPEQESCSTDPDHQADAVGPKHQESPQKPSFRKKETCALATVTEETNGDGETDWLTDDSPEQSGTGGSAANREHQPESSDLQSANQRADEATQVVKEEKSLTSTPVKVPPSLVPPQLAQLRTENADSFDMEEIQSNEDEGLPSRTSRDADLLRTVSQQSDSSGFAEEPSADSNSYLKVQESSDSCDSETTVTSHPSQDVATPLALDQPAFDLPDVSEEAPGPGVAGEADGTGSSRKEDEPDGSSEEVLQYTSHHFPRNTPTAMQQDETQDETQEEVEVPAEGGDRTDPELEPELEPEPEPEIPHSMSAAEHEPQHTQNQTETAMDTEPHTEGVEAEDKAQEEHASIDLSGLSCLPAPSSPVLCALNRAKHNHLSRAGLHVDLNPSERPQTLGRGQGRRRFPMQRSSSLPSSLLSPSRVVSSVRIQFGRGDASCTQPRYSFRYTQEDGEEVEDEEEEGQTTCLSTLLINPASKSGSNKQPPRLPTDTLVPPKPIPRHLMRSSCSLNCSSPPPDWSPGGSANSWSSQSISDLSSNHQLPGHSQQKMTANQNQQSFLPGLVSAFGQGHGLHPGLAPPAAPGPGPSQVPSSTEMQLRRVLHDIRGTVQSLSQNRADTPDTFSEHTAAPSSHQSLAEFQQRRRSLNLFRSQMMDLELSIMRQQAQVYKHLSPADRLEVEQLQSLRSAVREELQELEQQLEDRLTQHRVKNKYKNIYGLHRDSVDSLSTASALRAMEPVSDLLGEQLFLRSELSYDDHTPSTNPSSRSSSPVRGRRGEPSEQSQGVYRASINITPAPPPRPNTQPEEEEEGERDEGGGGGGGEGGGEVAEEEGAAAAGGGGGGIRVENLQQLIREIRESVAQEVRREIYSELLAAVSPRQSPLPTRQHPL
ncbi:putative sperm-specific antigen 2 [Scophthalmus maximus]|uniref:Putative sperm-specific antigen 2 n=1 Tax=Scophthalmus maximus TaxID=52904 RepID=A0A2U9CA04_SCOMX|nr:putative sperm-specific antigen 2 [Scophthalmus maximus]